jgi:hypothetical protein
MIKRRHSIKLLLVTAVSSGLLIILFHTPQARALNPQPLPPGEFGMIGLVPGQIARLNVVNTITNDDCRNCSVEGGHASVTLTFFDATGNQLLDSTGAPLQSTATLEPGQSTFLDLTMPQGPPNLPVSVAARTQIRAEVTGTWSGPGDLPLGLRVISTLEILDSATGRTTMAMLSTSVAFPHNPG